MSNAWSFETRQIHAGQEPDSATGARPLPICQTTPFVFPSAESAAGRFALAEIAPIHTRFGNPTRMWRNGASRAWKGGLAALIFGEAVSNPRQDVLDIEGIPRWRTRPACRWSWTTPCPPHT